MRIACVFVPHIPLQAVVRRRPALRKHAVAIVSGGPASSVLACSRQAFAAGVRVGMAAYVARQRCAELPEFIVESRDLEAELQLESSLAESLYSLSSRVEAEQLQPLRKRSGQGAAGPLPGQGAVFAEVPAGMRGATFGARVLELAEELGISARVGIADDRFTAWVAARHAGAVAQSGHHDEPPVIAIPRGGSAAFLAPQALSLLDISPEVQQMLAALGVRTLGEFASLPAPSVARHWDVDFQGLARGEGGAQLIPLPANRLPLREEVVLQAEHGVGEAVSMVADRIALRLAGRAAVATAMEVAVETAQGLESSALGLVPPLEDAQELADRIGRAVGTAPVRRLIVAVTAAQLEDGRAVASAAAEASLPPMAPVVLAFGGGASAATVAQATREPGEARQEQPIGMSGALLRRVDSSAGASAHRRTRKGKQRRRIATAQARLFGND